MSYGISYSDSISGIVRITLYSIKTMATVYYVTTLILQTIITIDMFHEYYQNVNTQFNTIILFYILVHSIGTLNLFMFH